jgi:hypothetical protein
MNIKNILQEIIHWIVVLGFSVFGLGFSVWVVLFFMGTFFSTLLNSHLLSIPKLSIFSLFYLAVSVEAWLIAIYYRKKILKK